MNFHYPIPEYFNIGTACTDAHATGPLADKAAVIVESEDGGVEEISFRALAEASSRFAARLQAEGLCRGDRVLLRLANGLDFPIAFFAILKAGGIAVPTSPLLTEREVDFVQRDSGARFVLKSPLAPLLQRGGKDDLLLQTGEQTRAEDPAYLIYTSGTTAEPKGVLHAHRALIGRQPASREWLDLSANARVLHTGALNWTYTLGTGLMDPLYRGATVILWKGSHDPSRWPRLIAAHEATHLFSVPGIYRQILEKTEAGKKDVPTLRHSTSAGEALSPSILDAWEARFGLPIYEGFGMSECSYYISQPAGRAPKRGSMGKAQHGHNIVLLNNDLSGLSKSNEGIIGIPYQDPALFLKYWTSKREENPDLPFFITGDRARRDDEGYFYFLGRCDHLINSLGYRISPEEIEAVYRAHPDIADCVALGEEVAPGKTLVVAYLIPKPDHLPNEAQLLAHGEQNLARYKCPRKLYFVKEFPRTPNGKVVRRALNKKITLTL